MAAAARDLQPIGAAAVAVGLPRQVLARQGGSRRAVMRSRVQVGAFWCILVPSYFQMADIMEQKRFTVSLEQADYEALIALGRSVSPPLNLQYLIRLSVRRLLDQHAEQQLALPLEHRP